MISISELHPLRGYNAAAPVGLTEVVEGRAGEQHPTARRSVES